MQTAFLHVPERYAGFPIGINEAIGIGLRARFSPQAIKEMGDGATLPKMIGLLSDSLYFGLFCQDFHAYVQSPSTGSWYRIPVVYWWFFGKKRDDGVIALGRPLPDFLERKVGLRAPADDIWDQPIVLWREDYMRAMGDAPISLRVIETDSPPHQLSKPASPDDDSGSIPDQRRHQKQREEAWYMERVAAIGAGKSSRSEDEAAGLEVGIKSPRVRALRQLYAPVHWRAVGRPKSDEKT